MILDAIFVIPKYRNHFIKKDKKRERELFKEQALEAPLPKTHLTLNKPKRYLTKNIITTKTKILNK